jgi:hypothetical protein
MDGSVYPNKDFIAASKLCVNIFCNKEDTHGTKKYGADEFCNDNYGQICAEHVKNHEEMSSKFFKGTILNPTTIICLPDGTEFKRNVGAMAAKAVIDMLKEAQTKIGGTGISLDQYTFGKDKLKAAATALEAKKTKDAIDALTAITKTFAKQDALKPMLEQAQRKLDEISEAGMALVEAAKTDAAAGKADDAKKALLDVSKNYKGLECAKAADRALAEMNKK